jgi:hypothetical protein
MFRASETRPFVATQDNDRIEPPKTGREAFSARYSTGVDVSKSRIICASPLSDAELKSKSWLSWKPRSDLTQSEIENGSLSNSLEIEEPRIAFSNQFDRLELPKIQVEPIPECFNTDPRWSFDAAIVEPSPFHEFSDNNIIRPPIGWRSF